MIDANQNEIEILKEEKQIYIEQNKGIVPNEEFNATKKAYDARITELETGAVPVQKRLELMREIPSLFGSLGAFAERSTQQAEVLLLKIIKVYHQQKNLKKFNLY